MAKKKTPIEEAPTYNIYVVCDYKDRQTSDGDENGGTFSNRGDTERSWSFKRLSGKDGEDCHRVSFKPIEGKTYFVLISLNDGGDSFGHDSNRFLEIWDIYETSEAANKAELELSSCTGKKDIEYTNHQGKLVKTYNPWLGMFSGCGDIRVEYLVYYDI